MLIHYIILIDVYETGKSMKHSRSGFGSKTSAQPILFISVKEKYIFSLNSKFCWTWSCVLFHNLTGALRKHTAPLIHLACLSQSTQTPMSEKAYSLMIKAKQLGIKPPGLFYRGGGNLYNGLIKDRLGLLLAQVLTRTGAHKAFAVLQQH